MVPNIADLFRVAQGAAMLCGIGLGICELASLTKIDPVGHVRNVAYQLEQDTVPAKGRVVYRVLTGYFPKPPQAIWEFETAEDWPTCEESLRQKLGTCFTIVATSGDGLAGVSHMGGEVQGITVLCRQTSAAVLNVVAVPTRRWIFKRSWDRFQIPKPFCKIDIFVAGPIWPQQDERIEEYRRRIEQSLCQLETLCDAVEVEKAATHEKHPRRKSQSASSAA